MVCGHCSCIVVDKTLALLTRGRRFDSRLHQSVGRDFKPWPCLHMTLAVGGTLNTNTTTKLHYVKQKCCKGYWYEREATLSRTVLLSSSDLLLFDLHLTVTYSKTSKIRLILFGILANLNLILDTMDSVNKPIYKLF